MRFPTARLTPRSVVSTATGAVALALSGLGAGLISVREPDLALPIALVVLLVGIAAIDLSLIPVLVLPATLVTERVGPMSGADLVLGGAMIVALLMLRGRGAITLQPLLWAGVCYLALSAPQLILNPYSANVIEWGHEIVLVLGSMIVGFVIGREGKAKLALTIYLVICIAIGVMSGVTALTNGFQPVFLGGLHKNAIGAILMTGGLVAFANPPWLGWRPSWAYITFAICGVGALAAQSRQALIGMLVGVLVVGLRPRFHNGKRSRWMWLILLPVAFFVYSEVAEQLGSDNRFNSSQQRLDWYADSIDVWLMSPIFGVGHRWWVTGYGGYFGFQPPNVELEVLTTVGVLGLIGFFGMFAGAIWLLAKMDPVYGTVGLAVVIARLAQTQFDLYWVAGHASTLWIIAGICYGVQARDKAEGIVRIPHAIQTLFRRTRGVRA